MPNHLSRKRLFLATTLLVVLNLFIWSKIVYGYGFQPVEIFFLDVGQGDASLLKLKSGHRVLIDGGPDSGLVGNLDEAMAQDYKYLDLVAVSHPERDHFAGMNYLLDYYDVGAFLYSGREPVESETEWQALKTKLKAKNIPILALVQKDFIKIGSDEIEVISPGPDFWQSGELNDTSLVLWLKTDGARALFVGDIGESVERAILSQGNVFADILKVGHHGSKYSSSEGFLAQVKPLVSVISVGARNNYGHPSPLAINRLKDEKSNVFRTDQSGTIRINLAENELRVFTER